MKRLLDQLGDGEYDLVIVGAGIHGACAARDAAMRGLRVALLDRGDFGGATSHNSLKLMHGGIRYLQHLELQRVRQSVRERRFWLAMAPHLSRPLKFVIPTYGHGTRGPEALWAGMKLHGLIGFDRNRGVIPENRIPPSEVVSTEECRRLIPELPQRNVNGGAVWHDGQLVDADRALLECVQAAATAGATVANYVRVDEFLRDDRRVIGVRVTDTLADRSFDIRARVTLNTAGPWAGKLYAPVSGAESAARRVELSKCMNLVTRRLFPDYAVGLQSARRSDAVVGSANRLFFFTPWREQTIIGTSHLPYAGDPDECEFTEADIDAFLEEINAAYPPAQLTRQDVSYCYGGLTPAEEGLQRGQVARARHGEQIDHQRLHGIEGLISIIGVKYTTARLVAEQAVDSVFAKLGQRPPPCTTHTTPLPGARGYAGAAALAREAEEWVEGGMTPVIEELLETYGTSYRSVLGDQPPGTASNDRESAFRLRCRYATGHEMAMKLEDVICRRTDYAARGLLEHADLEWCADMMSKELGWTRARRDAELETVQRRLHSAPVGSQLTGREMV